ncbi:MAG: hypothetical protein ABIP79_09225, partial [Chitinophagaceae bacterium]
TDEHALKLFRITSYSHPFSLFKIKFISISKNYFILIVNIGELPTDEKCDAIDPARLQYLLKYGQAGMIVVI